LATVRAPFLGQIGSDAHLCEHDRLARDKALAGHIETIIRVLELISIDEAGLNPIMKAVLTMVAEVVRLLAA
jgi:hypothetical protein